jgi:hypothetical protein
VVRRQVWAGESETTVTIERTRRVRLSPETNDAKRLEKRVTLSSSRAEENESDDGKRHSNSTKNENFCEWTR